MIEIFGLFKKQQGEHTVCPYCHENKDGLIKCLPRIGRGKAYIRHCYPVLNGCLLEIEQENFAHMTLMNIRFCPICGRRLES